MQALLDYLLILRALPKPIRGLLRANWLETCGNDSRIANTKIPCVENMVLVVALCFPVFLVTVFDTGILYQVAVFLYGCSNGLLIQNLGQVVTWSDLIKLFERGVERFPVCMLSDVSYRRWKHDSGSHARHYYESSNADQNGDNRESRELGGGNRAATASLARNMEFQSQDYAKWTPFAHVWDVRSAPTSLLSYRGLELRQEWSHTYLKPFAACSCNRWNIAVALGRTVSRSQLYLLPGPKLANLVNVVPVSEVCLAAQLPEARDCI